MLECVAWVEFLGAGWEVELESRVSVSSLQGRHVVS